MYKIKIENNFIVVYKNNKVLFFVSNNEKNYKNIKKLVEEANNDNKRI